MRLIQRVERVLGDSGRSRTEADEAQRGRHQLEVGVGLDPGGEQACQADVLGDPCTKARSAEVTDHHPEFEGAESPAEGDPRVHRVLHRAGRLRLEVARGDRQRRPEDLHSSPVEGACHLARANLHGIEPDTTLVLC
jgi:hypothetical protein